MSGIIEAQSTCRWDVEVNRHLLPIAQVWKSDRCSASVGLRFKSGWEYKYAGETGQNWYVSLLLADLTGQMAVRTVANPPRADKVHCYDGAKP